jgi:hypothetical protein
MAAEAHTCGENERDNDVVSKILVSVMRRLRQNGTGAVQLAIRLPAETLSQLTEKGRRR